MKAVKFKNIKWQKEMPNPLTTYDFSSDENLTNAMHDIMIYRQLLEDLEQEIDNRVISFDIEIIED